MPFELTNHGDYALTCFYGVLTVRDLQRLAVEAAIVDDSGPVAVNRITDLTGVTSFAIDYAAMSHLTVQRRAKRLRNAVKSALIARRDVEIGFARMFQTLNDNPQIEIRIVKDLAEALAWFAEGSAAA